MKLYLLDSNDAANYPAHRGHYRRALRRRPGAAPAAGAACSGSAAGDCFGRSGVQPEVCHLNEGHAAFAVLERARSFMEADGAAVRGGARRHARGQSLHHAHGRGGRLRPLRAGAHRAIPGRLCAAEARAYPLDELLALGRANPNDSSETFNMAYLAMRGSGAVNGVSRLHGR